MLTVLLVEDHPMNRKLFRDILEMQFAVYEAASAEDALETLRTVTPDLIVLDVQLPGMDGLTMLRQVKADPATRDVPVVALSSHSISRYIKAAPAAGCVDTIT